MCVLSIEVCWYLLGICKLSIDSKVPESLVSMSPGPFFCFIILNLEEHYFILELFHVIKAKTVLSKCDQQISAKNFIEKKKQYLYIILIETFV